MQEVRKGSGSCFSGEELSDSTHMLGGGMLKTAEDAWGPRKGTRTWRAKGTIVGVRDPAVGDIELGIFRIGAF